MAKEEGGATSTSVDALTIFTFLWSNICVLQCVKHYHSVKHQLMSQVVSLDVLLFLLLVASVFFAVIQPHKSSALLSLCASHIISLMYQGSQSNHVIMAIVIAFGVLLDYSADRVIWQKRLSATTYLILVILYLVSWTHKLNEDWFDFSVSCSALFSSGFASMWLSLPTAQPSLGHQFADAVIRNSPRNAAIVEITLPSLLLLWRATSTPTFTKMFSTFVFKFLITLAASFHLMICLPLPPMSVYPFSMVMVPMYILTLPEGSIKVIGKISNNMWVVAGIVAALSVAVKYTVGMILNGEEMPLEYPAYGLWTTAVVWNVLVWAGILYATFTVTTSESMKAPTFTYRSKGVILALFLGFIGICPYLGIRNYPALAMFSNLRTEGSSPNHRILPPMAILSFQSDTVHIHDTNLQSLRHYQVNLASYFSEHTKRFNTASGVTNEFWITPPSWTPPDSRPTPFVPYSIPVIELRKHISSQANKDFYVNFTMNADPAHHHIFYSSDPGSYDSYGHLTLPVSWLERGIFRFRSFDSTYSPCRH